MLLAAQANATGGGVGEASHCIVKIGFYTAHFSLYQPQTSGNDEFCQDLPLPGDTLFVLDYLHDTLKDVKVGFRIIKNVTDLGRFAKWRDVDALENIENHTVYFQRPVIRTDGRLSVNFHFSEAGDYLVVVTAAHPSKSTIYHAVFPINVDTSNGYWWVVLAVLAVVLTTGLFFRFRVNFSKRTASRQSDKTQQ